jgi:hypothetical protein
MVVFMTKAFFGFSLAAFSFASLWYEMIQDEPNAEFTTMHFSLISFVAGYFLGSSPRLANVQPNTIGLSTDPSMEMGMEEEENWEDSESIASNV